MQLVERLRSLPILALAAVGALFIASAAAVATLSVTTATTSIKLSDEAISADSGVTIDNSNLTQTASTVSAAGATVGASEEAIPTAYATVSPGVTATYWMYTVDVHEAAVGSWGATACYKIEVFGDGDLLGTGYLDNGTANGASVEGVTFKVEVATATASSVPGNFTTKVTATTGCA